MNNYTEKELDMALNNITYEMIKSMKSCEIINHTKDYHLYKYSHDDECCDEDGGIIVIKENSTDEELMCVLMNTKTKELVYDVLVDCEFEEQIK